VFSIASELVRRGWSPAIAVPASSAGVSELGRPGFQILTYRQVRRGRLAFPDGEGPDLVHAFTPRSPVRRLTADVVSRHGCRYVVHLEDNEAAVQAAVITGHDPDAASTFLSRAVGVSVIIDRLLELKPSDVPGVVVWPGYDEALDRPGRSREAVRRDVGLEDGQLAILYSGNVHEANADEVAGLYEAVERLRAEGRDLVLVKSGWTEIAASRLPRLGDALRDVGWISRGRVFELLRGSDILVQPGAPGAFNDYRFPSKLPEFLASRRPVVLPRTNIGLHLEDGVEALLLDEGGAAEIHEKVALLADDPQLRKRLGEAGRAFAVSRLRWSSNVGEVVRLYESVV
jgi:glycosyltransferase involved in cell wall biosynthesis